MRVPIATLLVVAAATAAWAQGLPKAVTIGSNPPGTGYYAVASGLAKVVSQGTGMQMAVQPHSGTSTMLPLLDNGEMEFGTINAVDVGLAYRGPNYKIGGRNPFQHSPNVRVIQRGAPLLVGLLVRKDSPIKSVTDVKGKRMTGEYPAHLAVWYNMFGHLASAGLTWSDVKVVPVPAVNDGVDALVQGRADVTEHALGAAKTKEADTAVGVRHVSIDCSPEGQARLKKAVPGYYGRVVKAGTATAVRGRHLFPRLRHLPGREQERARRRRRGDAEGHLGPRRGAAPDPPAPEGVDTRPLRRPRADAAVPYRGDPLLQGQGRLEPGDGPGPAEGPDPLIVETIPC